MPDFLVPASSTVYLVSDFTLGGAEKLLRLLTSQPEVTEPPLGPVPVLEPRQDPLVPVQQQRSGARNVVTGDVSGVVIQAGSVGSMTVPGVPAPHSTQVGEGADPRTKRAFEDAFRLAGGAGRLGHPTGQVLEEGPGFVQHFAGTGGRDAVICAIAGQAAVAVAGPVWDDLSALPGSPVHGAGFPIARIDPAASGLIDYLDSDANAVNLDGGGWGAGVLLRATEAEPARWQPKARLSLEAREALQLPAAGPADLTVRAIATLPWQLDDEDDEITRRTRQQLESTLPQAEISELMQILFLWRGGRIAPPQWERASGPDVRQTGRDARYDQTVLDPVDGNVAVRAVARIMLPDRLSSAIRVAVEFQVNFAAWRSALVDVAEGEVTDMRITANEIVELWATTWHTATVVVPSALVSDPESVPLLAPPTVELQVKMDDGAGSHSGEARSLTDVIDLSVFGESDGRPGCRPRRPWSPRSDSTATIDVPGREEP